MTTKAREWPIPPHFDGSRVGEVRRVPYGELAAEAAAFARDHDVQPASEDRTRVGLLAIDVQNTFCLPGFGLFVGGAGDAGPLGDCRRLCEFVYRNLGRLTCIVATLDTHTAMQVFHPLFLVNENGEHPPPMTPVRPEQVRSGEWKANPALAAQLGMTPEQLDAHLEHYCGELERGGKYDLMIWPYHAMLGGIGHALVSAVEEAFFFHAITRQSPTRFETKGRSALTESYSALRPEVLIGSDGKPLGASNTELRDLLLAFDILVVAGQAKSHCVAWTVEDLLAEIGKIDPALARKVYLLDDCSSPVVVPGVADFSEAAESAFARFETAGMHRVRSIDPLQSWPGV
jgi:nicotinamidase-related amidase